MYFIRLVDDEASRAVALPTTAHYHVDNVEELHRGGAV